ncbi:hypothetical protein KJ877_06055 [bacterium]|nr:hypothetical protein [bacterium]MBU1989748.1 hypothetical protein [bacterium]
MNLKEFENKTILLFGKSRAFTKDEFDAQMDFYKITVLKEYADDVVLIVDGRMMTPYEQNKSEALYEEKKAEFCSIDDLENELAKHIDTDVLLMSLKLSHDKQRLKGFLQNTMIDDALFLRLLKMYRWSGEDFFENDDNRDVTAALISRFYENIERNHNVQYATLGLMHLVVQAKDSSLIEAIVALEPLQKSFKSNAKDANYSIVTAIATHHHTSTGVLKMLIKKSNTYVKTLIAMRADCLGDMQKMLYESGDAFVVEALSHNKNLDKELASKILQENVYSKNIARHINLNDEIFEVLIGSYPKELACNESLTPSMQERLVGLHDADVNLALASNAHLDENIVMKLLCESSEEIQFCLYSNVITSKEQLEEAYLDEINHRALCSNENTPAHILKKLGESEDIKVLEELAKNQNTPVEVLYQLQLDSRFERFVKENQAFGKHIQSQNIGWQV